MCSTGSEDTSSYMRADTPDETLHPTEPSQNLTFSFRTRGSRQKLTKDMKWPGSCNSYL